MVHWRVIAVATVVFLMTAGIALAEHEADNGWIHGGVSSEEEARAYPCPTTALGGWERTGPVVCLQKQADNWQLEASPEGTGCTYDTTGWHGSCVFDLDAGDHIRVWGTRGIGWTAFTVTWLHPLGSTGDPSPTPTPSPTLSPTSTPAASPTPAATPSPTPAPVAQSSPAPPRGDSTDATPSTLEPATAPATSGDVTASPAANDPLTSSSDPPVDATSPAPSERGNRSAWLAAAVLLIVLAGTAGALAQGRRSA
jgi:hypothetical protein